MSLFAVMRAPGGMGHSELACVDDSIVALSTRGTGSPLDMNEALYQQRCYGQCTDDLFDFVLTSVRIPMYPTNKSVNYS